MRERCLALHSPLCSQVLRGAALSVCCTVYCLIFLIFFYIPLVFVSRLSSGPVESQSSFGGWVGVRIRVLLFFVFVFLVPFISLPPPPFLTHSLSLSLSLSRSLSLSFCFFFFQVYVRNKYLKVCVSAEQAVNVSITLFGVLYTVE